jgi:hypothetical protein
MDFWAYISQYTGLSITALQNGPDGPLVRPLCDVEGNVSFPIWKVEGKDKPTPQQVAAALAGVPALADLQATLAAAASTACASITTQVAPDQAHQFAFTNAAAILNAAGGVAPSSGPLAAKFAELAAAFGHNAADFAVAVLAIQGASLDLGAALTTLLRAAAAATSPGDLASALTAFEASLANVVSEVTAAGMVIAAPPAISIRGVNA